MRLTAQPSGGRRKRFRTLGLLAVGLAIGWLVVLALATRTPPAAIPKVTEVIDGEETRAQAEAGDAEAQYRLGAIHAQGQGVPQSYGEAARWYRQAAEQGHAGAQAALGELHEAGQGVPRDDAEAAKWYRRAAEQGHVVAQYSLAVLYLLGKGVPRDLAEAVQWYRQAAEQGNALAQYNLGMRHNAGDGVPQDSVEAYKWLSLAAAQGLTDAAKARDELKRRMTRDQRTEGQRRVAAFVPKKPAPPAR